MMGIQSGQIHMVIPEMDFMIPVNNLLRQIKDRVKFDFIYEKAAPYYFNIGRKSIDSVYPDKNAAKRLSLCDHIRAKA